jgi:endothelin-converting enzyme/putative endopeptidase
LQPLLDRIAALESRRQLPSLLADLHLVTGNERLFFGFSSGQDYADATRQIASLWRAASRCRTATTA